MLQLCYSHDVPLLRPYRPHIGHSGTSTPENLQISTIFHFENCDVAKYLISEFGDSLQHKNGVPTRLAIHVKDCDKCKYGATKDIVSEFEYVAIHRDLLKILETWFKKEFPNQKFDQCLQLMHKEILFWRSEQKRKKK